MKVTITPKSQRAKNRVREHGEVMILVRKEGNDALFESLEETFSLTKGIKMKWSGWFSQHEASYKPI